MRFLRRLFRREPPPPAPLDRRFDNEGWKPGDLAVCVRDDWILRLPDAPKKGDLLRVFDVIEGEISGMLLIGLRFVGKCPGHAWQCTCFRKVRLTLEPAEEEFIELVKRPVRPKVDA